MFTDIGITWYDEKTNLLHHLYMYTNMEYGYPLHPVHRATGGII